MSKQKKEEILKNYYFSISNPAAYSSPEKVYRVLKKRYPGQFSRYFIQKWLDGIDAYSVQKQVRQKFKTPKVRVTSIDSQFDADISDVSNIAKENDGIRYLLFVMDIFSRFLWVKPLKDKTAKSVLEGLKEVFKERKPIRLRVDKGSEFVNRWVKKYLKDNDVYLFVTQSVNKANYVERVQKSFRVLLWRYLRHKRNYRYIDDLQKLVGNYNSTPHRSLNFTAPKDVNKNNEADLWAYMYLRKPAKKTKSISKKRVVPYKFKIADLVRISHMKHPFRRAYQQQYTTEIFKIAKRYRKQGIPMYKLKDWNDDPIIGSFYTSELTPVSKDVDGLFFIEKVLKRRKRGAKTQLYVKWDGYPSSMNSWVDKDTVQTT